MKRRKFLVNSAAVAAAASIVPRHVLGGPGYVAPSDRVHIAIAGAGGRGRKVLRGMLQEPTVRAIAVADPAKEFSLQNFYYRDVGGREPTQQLIDEHYKQAGSASKCTGYENFEEMLAEEKDVDAVICGAPDHLHAYISAKCLQAGKHVYCEKPLTHNISEARQLAKIARESGLATQMGNQGHSTDGIRATCEWIWAGAIGDIKEVHAWVGGHRWNPELTGLPGSAEGTPAGLNWDLWQGPRDAPDFSTAFFPVAWRDFWAFGNSNIGDFGCHDLDAACWALNLQNPTAIEFHPTQPCNADIGPHGCVGYYDFAANDRHNGVRVTWYDGGLKPGRPKDWPADRPLPGRGTLFVGTEGKLFCPGAGGAPELLGNRPAPVVDKSLERVESHAQDWLRAIKGERPAGSNFEYGSQLTELALLGALSLRTGKRIDWNGQAMKANNLPEADKIIHESRRSGWEIT